jgi:sugar-specific transcriptional regulator TrmB
LGLVERTISRPVRFKALPLREGIDFLIKQKKQETKKMEQRAKKFIENYRQENDNYEIRENEPHFVLTARKIASLQKRGDEIDNAQKSIDFISSWKRFPRTIQTFGENGIKALERGVKMRVILEKPKLMNQIPELVKKLKEHPNYRLRYVIDNPKAIIGIFDKERAIIKTSASVGLAEKPSLWTDNPCFLSVLSDYFELMWITAMDKIPEKFVDL